MIYIARCTSPVQPDSHLQINQSQQNNGQYIVTVSFYCDSGYVMEGPNSTTCHFPGMWIPQPPECIAKINAVLNRSSAFIYTLHFIKLHFTDNISNVRNWLKTFIMKCFK